ncbi:MAG: BamA/TamA family outer membrane protein [Thermodesulfobacteriota bacterium]|nr:BamA/TamA family outer membrane protein [Thermodesulfobacteriota bacterium]
MLLLCPLMLSALDCNAGDQADSHVSRVSITGASRFSSDEIKEFMIIKERGVAFWKDAPFDSLTFEGDLERIIQLYHSAGYYDVKVSHTLSTGGNGGTGSSIHLDIDEGEPTRVVLFDIDISGCEADRLYEIPEDLPLNVGDIFDTLAYNSTKKFLSIFFADHGFGQVKVRGDVQVYKKEHQAELRLKINPGMRFHVSEVSVSGNDSVAVHIITREMKVKPAELYSLTRIQDDQRALYNLDLFSSVVVRPYWPEDDSKGVALVVIVKEKPPRVLRLGIGYGTEEKLRLRAELGWRNLLNQGYSLTFTGKYSSILSILESEFKNPYFMGKNDLTLTHQAGAEFEYAESFNNRRYFSKFTVSKAWTPYLSQFVAHNIETNHTTKLPGGITEKAIEDFGRKEDVNFIVSSLEAGCTWKHVDNVFNPTKGLYLSYVFEPALSSFGSEIEFLRHLLELRGYYPVYKMSEGNTSSRDVVMAARITMGTVDPIQSNEYIPISKRFFCGGASSVRGYPYEELGEMDDYGNPVGGYSLFEGSLEFRFPLVEELNGVLFFDTGNVYPDPYDFDFDKLRHCVGFGLRYHTAVGPIRLDIGYQLNPQDPDAPEFRVHLNLGEAF